MSHDQQKAIDEIEKDRRAKEDELLLLMLIVFGEAIRYAAMAIKIDCDPPKAASKVVLGSAALGLAGIGTAAAILLATAHEAGMKRAAVLMGTTPLGPGDVIPTITPTYEATAGRMATAMADTMSTKITEATAEATGTAKSKAAEVAAAIEAAGYGKPNPYLLRTVSEKMVVDAYGAGMFVAMMGNDDVTGFVHRSVLDRNTTRICDVREGFMRPKDDPYWLTNFPSLHFGCRSLILPVFGKQKWSEGYPPIPPAAGFGTAPLAFTRSRAA